MKIWAPIAVLLLAIMAAPAAQADLVLVLDDLSTAGLDVVITDNGAGDSAAIAGIISYSSFADGAVGAFDIQLTTGTSKPFLGNTDDVAKMKLSNLSITTTAGGTLRIFLTDTDFVINPNPGGFSRLIGQIGGVVGNGGVVTGSTSYDALNREFGSTHTGSTGPHTSAFSEVFFVDHIPYSGGAFSLTQTILVTLPSWSSMSLDFDSTFLPEPSSVALLGLGALVLGGLRRKRRKVS